MVKLRDYIKFWKNVEDEVKSQKQCIGDLSEFFLLFKEKIMCTNHKIKSNYRVPIKYEVDTHGAPVFGPDNSVIVLGAKICTNASEHSMYIRFLWFNGKLQAANISRKGKGSTKAPHLSW